MKKMMMMMTVLLLSAATLSAQVKNKKGVEMLPKAKDLGLAIDAVPFLEFAGNIFNNTSDNDAPTFSFTEEHPLVITGKYVASANKYYRARARLGFSSDKTNYKVQDDIATMSDPNSEATLDDEVVVNSTDIYLSGGIEYRRGRGRVQGFFGPEAGIGFSTMKTKHNFANNFTSSNTTPSTSIPGQSGVFPRTTEVKDGTTIMIGLRGFAGVEYFFAPLVSVSGEFGWGIMFNNTGEGAVSTEEWDGIANEVDSDTNNTGSATGFSLDTDNASGSININFYF